MMCCQRWVHTNGELMPRLLLTTTLTVALLGGLPIWAQPISQHLAVDISPEAEQARKLLQRAVKSYTLNGERTLAAFSRSGEFIDGAHYVYAISLKGVMLASGGSSSTLIGRNVTDLVDATGKPFFREMIEGAKVSGSGQIEYRWLNQIDNKVERKITYYQLVGDRILAVGFYVPHATREQAKVLLNDAIQAIKSDPEKAFAAFNNLNGRFIQDDLYVFVVDLGDKRFRAHGADPRLVGTNGLALRSPKGKLVIQEMLKLLKTSEQAELVYDWNNPVTRKVEIKHTVVRKVDNFLVGVGYYTR
jgi:cytochrome c